MPKGKAKKVKLLSKDRDAVTGRILVVDDEKQNLRLLKAILAPAGHEIFTSDRGEEALEKVRELNPDLVLLDVMMPEMDGYEVLSVLRDSDPGREIPIIMVTSLDDTQSRIKALEAGADDFVTKPISTPVLTARVRSLLKVKAYYDAMKDQKQFLEEEVAVKTGELKRYSNQLEILNQAGVMINSVLDTRAILKSVAQASLELWNSDGSAAGVVDDGSLLFRDWYWAREHYMEPFRWDILDRLQKMDRFMELIHCERSSDHICGPLISAGVEVDDCLLVPIHDRKLKVQACLVLFNPDAGFDEQGVHENPLPGLIASAATALDNTRNLAELRDKEEELQVSLREKELLLKEIHHRVKNNLQAIVGLMEAHLGTIQDPGDRLVFLKGQSLAMSISMIHELLYRTENYASVEFRKYTDKLVKGTLSLYPEVTDRVRFNLEIDEVALNTDTAVPVSLIINELVSNALTHAFPGNGTGNVNISLNKLKNNEFLLEIADDGIGIEDSDVDPEGQSLGLSLVNSLVENLDGSMDVKINGGTRVIIRFREYFECEDLELE